MERGSNGAEATALCKVEPALITLRTSVRPACSGSASRSCIQECALSSPRTPASCTTSSPAMAEHSTTRQPARMTAEAMRAICARWSTLEDFASSQASGTAEKARMHLAAASQSPGVFLDMTSSPGTARSEQHLAKDQSPAPAQAATKTPHKAHAPDSLGARLRASAREAAAATIAEGSLVSMSKAPEDNQEQQHQGASGQLGRSGVLGKRLRDGTAVITTSREPEVGDLAAALELEEATPGPAAPLRLRRVSFNLPEPPCRPKGNSPPAGFCIHRVSPRKVAPWLRKQSGLKRRSGSASPHQALSGGGRLPGSPHHMWARLSAQATVHTAPALLQAAGHASKLPEDVSDGLDEEEGLLNLVRRLSYERPPRPAKRARLSTHPTPVLQAPAADMVEQEVREAYMNSTLAKHWLAGEDWAALDYNGLELSHAAASAHQAKNQEVLERMTALKGQGAATQLMEHLEKEWQQLMSMRQRYASAPAAAQGTQCCASADPRQTPAKSILKRRSLGALHELQNQVPRGKPTGINWLKTPVIT
ncbi:g6479 [Coccomyxa elongata]